MIEQGLTRHTLLYQGEREGQFQLNVERRLLATTGKQVATAFN